MWSFDSELRALFEQVISWEVVCTQTYANFKLLKWVVGHSDAKIDKLLDFQYELDQK